MPFVASRLVRGYFLSFLLLFLFTISSIILLIRTDMQGSITYDIDVHTNFIDNSKSKCNLYQQVLCSELFNIVLSTKYKIITFSKSSELRLFSSPFTSEYGYFIYVPLILLMALSLKICERGTATPCLHDALLACVVPRLPFL